MASRPSLAPALLALSLAVVGCGPSPGAAGLWEIRPGGRAKVVGEGGAPEIVIETLAAPSPKAGRGPRKGEAPRVESVTLASGTGAEVLAVDGDDARVRILDGPRAGSVYWIACPRLEPAD